MGDALFADTQLTGSKEDQEEFAHDHVKLVQQARVYEEGVCHVIGGAFDFSNF